MLLLIKSYLPIYPEEVALLPEPALVKKVSFMPILVVLAPYPVPPSTASSQDVKYPCTRSVPPPRPKFVAKWCGTKALAQIFPNITLKLL